MNPALVAIIGAAVIFVMGRLAARTWLIRRYRDGRMTGPTMLALLGVITVIPYLVIAAWGILVDPSSWWLFVIIFIATWPVVVLPVAALYYQAKQSRK